jgi:hypothetical protein
MDIQAQVAEIIAALKLFRRLEDVTELRALGVRSYNGHKMVMNGYFNNIDLFAKEAANLSGRAEGVYFTPNPVNPALLARAANRVVPSSPDSCTKDHEIISRRWLPVDVDPVRPRGVSATDQEHELAIARGLACREFLIAQGWPDPIVGDSGNGCHLFFPLDLPNDEEARDLVKRVLEALAARFDDEQVKIDTATYNAARVMKIPGTMACKGDSIPAQPHRLANLFKEGRA